ncbi:uncharacterized protein TNCV_3366211 [Trichonephila clavipes]|nr:uncharacterized protein TNCV_3366211 [Trichonephila clavipes]
MPIVSKYPNEIVTLDLLGPYPATRPERYKFILVISDHFTKWCELIPLRKASAQAIANALFDNYIARYGAPISLISDNGPQFISDVFEHISHRVLEVKGNNLIIWKSGKRVTVNIDQVRVYRPRQTDTISSDSQVETLYDEQGVSHRSNIYIYRSNQGQFKEHRKTSSKKSEGCRSRQGNTARENPRNKRKMSNNESKDQVLKRSKMCRKRSLQGSEHKDRKRLAPEQRQGVKRSIPPSILSRTYKFKRPNTSSQEVESIAGSSRLPDCRLNKSTTVESRTEGSGRDNKTRQTRATTRGRKKQAERPVRSNPAPTRRPFQYYLRSRVKESDGIPEEQRNIEINGFLYSRIRRRSLSMEALDGDPVHRRI